jgi:phospholipid-binding lipoprotein MlaA
MRGAPAGRDARRAPTEEGVPNLHKLALHTRRRAATALGTLIAAALVVAGCATAPENDPAAMEAYRQANDPAEPFNRTMFDFNMGLDKAVLKPVAGAYRDVVPEGARDSVSSFLDNLRTPVIFANDLMQAEFERAGVTLLRFVTNTTIGFGGFFDVAADEGLAKHDEDFGQTLAVWGLGEGAYLMLPLFGPSNPRDGVGRVVDIFLDPIGWLAPIYVNGGRSGAEAIDARAVHYDEINDLERNSLDFYAAVRSLYRQKRADEIRNGVPTAGPSFAPTPTGLLELHTPDQRAGTQR